MLSDGMSIEEIVMSTLEGFDTEVLDTSEPQYLCKCDRRRVKSMLKSLGREELLSMAEDLPEIEVKCHFCNKAYKFTPDEVREMAKQKKFEKS